MTEIRSCLRNRTAGGSVLWLSILVMLAWIAGWSLDASADQALLRSVVLQDNPAGVRIEVTRKAVTKIIRVDVNEVLIAFKDLQPGPEFKVTGDRGTLIEAVDVEPLSSNVLAVVVTGARPFERVDSGWDSKGLTMTVTFGPGMAAGKTGGPVIKKPRFVKPRPVPGTPAPPPPPEKAPEPAPPAAGPEIQPKPSARTGDIAERRAPSPDAADKSYIPPTRESSPFAGDVSDLLASLDMSTCRSIGIDRSVELLKKGFHEKAFDLIDQEMAFAEGSCLEPVLFLRAYAYFRLINLEDAEQLLAAVGLFQDAMVTFPDSRLMPFALTAVGILQRHLNNPAAAEGFLTLVKDGFMDYPGIQEVLYHLAKIYADKGYNDKALDYFKAVFENYPESKYTVDAGIGMGKALLKKLHYIDAISILSYLIASNPEKIYDSPDLLVNMGNANLKLGRGGVARDNLIRAYNLFPEITGRDVIMSSIGDTYAMEGDTARAMNIYRFVMTGFPGTEGFVTSAIGLARHLKDRAEREKLYEMIKTEYPDHTMASIAMMRLAEIYENAGEYIRCIEEIENLLARHPRGLRYEAVKLMQKAYELLFEKQVETGQNSQVLKRYEGKKELLDRMESKALFLQVGLAYKGVQLYEPAFNELIKAYKLFRKASRPPELLIALGISMDETGRDSDAVNILKGFTERFPERPERVEAWSRLGLISLEKEQYGPAAAQFDEAYAASSDYLEKGTILLKKAGVYTRQKQWDKASSILFQATQDFASAPGKNYGMLSQSYKGLGESYVQQKLYIKAAEAFSTALTFSDATKADADLGFMLGDAYQKGNALDKAKEAFTRLVNTDDSIWSRLAQERLTTLELAEKVKES